MLRISLKGITLYHPEAIINTNNLIDNISYIKNYVGNNVKIMPVVKANAYGHGINEICKLLSKNDIDGCCVALLSEAINIRSNNLDNEILHLGSMNHEFHPIFLDKKLILTINSEYDINFLEEIGKINNHIFRVHIKIDTGMTRLGILKKDIKKIKESLINSMFIDVEGIYTQLSSADEDDQSSTLLQREKFIEVSDYFCKHINSIKFKHFTPSAGLLKDKKNHFNMVRPGISLYGVSNITEKHPLKPVLRLEAPVCLIKNVTKGSYIGYNKTYTNTKEIKVAIIQVGYADAVPIEFSNNGFVEFKGNKLNILGKVSMDLICVNIDNINIKKGDKVTVFGGDLTKLEIILKDKISTPYTLLTGITNRVKRIYN
jgi:alanine racemase